VTPYERVQQSRQLTAATFPLPSVLDCIRYAITELAEYDDALLRQERTGDKRNNDKGHDPRTELGQALYMLLSAAVQIEGAEIAIYPMGGLTPFTHYSSAMIYLAQCASIANLDHARGINPLMNDAYSALLCLADWHGWPVDALIDDTCAAFERKHAPVEVR